MMGSAHAHMWPSADQREREDGAEHHCPAEQRAEIVSSGLAIFGHGSLRCRALVGRRRLIEARADFIRRTGYARASGKDARTYAMADPPGGLSGARWRRRARLRPVVVRPRGGRDALKHPRHSDEL